MINGNKITLMNRKAWHTIKPQRISKSKGLIHKKSLPYKLSGSKLIPKEMKALN